MDEKRKRDSKLIRPSMNRFLLGTNDVWSVDCLRARMILPTDFHIAAAKAKVILPRKTKGKYHQSPILR